MAIVRKSKRQALDLGPDLPPEAAWIWAAYCELDLTRQNGMGVGPITHLEMLAYASLHGFSWDPPEVAIIRALDREFLIHHAELASKKAEGG